MYVFTPIHFSYFFLSKPIHFSDCVFVVSNFLLVCHSGSRSSVIRCRSGLFHSPQSILFVIGIYFLPECHFYMYSCVLRDSWLSPRLGFYEWQNSKFLLLLSTSLCFIFL